MIPEGSLKLPLSLTVVAEPWLRQAARIAVRSVFVYGPIQKDLSRDSGAFEK